MVFHISRGDAIETVELMSFLAKNLKGYFGESELNGELAK